MKGDNEKLMQKMVLIIKVHLYTYLLILKSIFKISYVLFLSIPWGKLSWFFSTAINKTIVHCMMGIYVASSQDVGKLLKKLMLKKWIKAEIGGLQVVAKVANIHTTPLDQSSVESTLYMLT